MIVSPVLININNVVIHDPSNSSNNEMIIIIDTPPTNSLNNNSDNEIIITTPSNSFNNNNNNDIPIQKKSTLLDHFPKEVRIVDHNNNYDIDDTNDNIIDNNNIIIEIKEKEKRNNNSKLYKDKRTEIISYCNINGPKKTLEKYSGIGLKQQTLSDWNKRAKEGKPIGSKKKGREEVVPEKLRNELSATIKEIREAGQEVHLQTIVNNIQSIIIQNNKGELLETYKIDKHWARRWALKNNYSHRKGTKGKLVKEFTEDSRNEFLMKLAITIKDNQIPDNLVLIFDETAINLCPTSKTTYNQKGDKQVILAMLDDKRQYTLGLGMNILLLFYLII